jgi:hypothetical protein
MSTSWQWFPETKTAVCCYCGFSAVYAGEFPGDLKHDCNPDLHPPIVTRQGLQVGRSPPPEALSRISLEQLLACVHRGAELRQEPCETCGAGTRIKIFDCEIHGECQLDDKIPGVKFCGDCADRTLGMNS